MHTEEQLRSELDRAIDCQAEGLMLKALQADDVAHSHTTAAGSAGSGAATSAGYEAGKRSLQWLKLKRDYIDGMGDTFDLVPIGAYRGRGKRSGAFGA